MYLTAKGITLNAKLITTEATLHFTRIAIGVGEQRKALLEMTELDLWYADLAGLGYSPPKPQDTVFQIRIYAEYKNEKLTEPLFISEVGVYALDPDEGEVLYAIDAHYDAPILINPPIFGVPGYGYGESAYFELGIEIARDLVFQIDFANRHILTLEEADGRYWIIGVKYPATEITESVGTTTEVHQRRQDADIELLKKRADEGISTGHSVTRSTEVETTWRIIDNKGYYDRVRRLIVA